MSLKYFLEKLLEQSVSGLTPSYSSGNDRAIKLLSAVFYRHDFCTEYDDRVQHLGRGLMINAFDISRLVI